MNRTFRTAIATLVAAFSVAVAIAAAPANAFDTSIFASLSVSQHDRDGYQRVSAGRPQTLAFKIGRFS